MSDDVRAPPRYRWVADPYSPSSRRWLLDTETWAWVGWVAGDEAGMEAWSDSADGWEWGIGPVDCDWQVRGVAASAEHAARAVEALVFLRVTS